MKELKTNTVSVDTTVPEYIQARRQSTIFTYRYMCKMKGNDKICVRYLSGLLSEHDDFVKGIQASDEIVSCIREYVDEIDCNFVGITETVKLEDKEDEEK